VVELSLASASGQRLELVESLIHEKSVSTSAPRGRRILVVGTSMGGGDWIPLATVMIGLHEAGHAVRCFGDSTIAQICATVSIPFEVVPDNETLPAYFARWRTAGAPGPSPLLAWAKDRLPPIRSLIADFRPEIVLSQLMTAELAAC
jgi:hypothetical protein